MLANGADFAASANSNSLAKWAIPYKLSGARHDNSVISVVHEPKTESDLTKTRKENPLV